MKEINWKPWAENFIPKLSQLLMTLDVFLLHLLMCFVYKILVNPVTVEEANWRATAIARYSRPADTIYMEVQFLSMGTLVLLSILLTEKNSGSERRKLSNKGSGSMSFDQACRKCIWDTKTNFQTLSGQPSGFYFFLTVFSEAQSPSIALACLELAMQFNEAQISETCLSPLDVFDEFNFKEPIQAWIKCCFFPQTKTVPLIILSR